MILEAFLLTVYLSGSRVIVTATVPSKEECAAVATEIEKKSAFIGNWSYTCRPMQFRIMDNSSARYSIR